MTDTTAHNYITCHTCGGAKQIKGLGNIRIECPQCKGIGWVIQPEQALEILETKKVYKRRKQKAE